MGRGREMAMRDCFIDRVDKVGCELGADSGVPQFGFSSSATASGSHPTWGGSTREEVRFDLLQEMTAEVSRSYFAMPRSSSMCVVGIWCRFDLKPVRAAIPAR